MRSRILARTMRTPVLNGTFQLIHRFYRKLCAAKNGELAVEMVAFACIFWMIKGMNLQNNSVGRIVYNLIYERGCAAPSGINRSCPQLHS